MFSYTDGKQGLEVRLAGKLVGHIKGVDGAYYYQVKGSKYRGENFPTIQATKDSLEGDE